MNAQSFCKPLHGAPETFFSFIENLEIFLKGLVVPKFHKCDITNYYMQSQLIRFCGLIKEADNSPLYTTRGLLFQRQTKF